MSFHSQKPTEDDMKRAMQMAADLVSEIQPEDSLTIKLLKKKAADLERDRKYAEENAKTSLENAQSSLAAAMACTQQRAELLRDIAFLTKGGVA